jgi:hypothetical protein
MPTTSRRAVTVVHHRETADDRGNEAPEETGGGTEVLDAISDPDPVGPFGQDLRYGPGPGTVNAVIHEIRDVGGAPIHELSARVDRLWRNDQPPIANISILGSAVVAAERNSE